MRSNPTANEAAENTGAENATVENAKADAKAENLGAENAKAENAENARASQPAAVHPTRKVWIFPEEKAIAQEVIDIALGSPIVAGLLVKRGITTAADARSFLDETSYMPTVPTELPDVDKAVNRIRKAIDDKQHITVYGDYDVDGVTGTSVLLTVLKELGADVDYYIPNRVTEGYGLNLKAISVLASKKKTKLIISCDCGVSNFAEINFARSLSVETIVLDHHTMPEVLPPAVAIVHPKLLKEDHPLFHLPGVGVAYKVMEALLASYGDHEKADELLDFVTLGMIADLVPLVRENRYLVKIGLEKLVKTNRVGLKALLAQVNNQNDTDLVGFGIAPRINAAGRLSDANKAVELLTTSDITVATEIAQDLQMENTRRQELCEKIFGEADVRVARMAAQPDWANQKCIAIYDREWHHGVVGIVASRLVEKYHRPVFIGQLEAEEGIVKGSARGVEQLDLYEVLKANEHLLTRWGGHKMAAGFTVEYNKADELCRSLVNTCNRMLIGKPLAGIVEIDLLVPHKDVDLTLARQLVVLAPFGMGNRKPRFCMKKLKVEEVRPLGKEGKHNRFLLKGGEFSFEAVMWSSNGRVPDQGQSIDLVFTADVNKFNGKERLQLVVNDWRSEYNGVEVRSLDEIKEDVVDVVAAPQTVATQFMANMSAAANTPTASPSSATLAASSTKSTQGANEGEVLARLIEDINLPVRDPIDSVKQVWRDLRSNERPEEVLKRGIEKLGNDIVVFAEACGPQLGVSPNQLSDRTMLGPVKHLMLWQFPPSTQVFQEILSATSPEHVYLMGSTSSDVDDAAQFLKRLFGLVRYAVNQKDGKVDASKLTALMGSTKVALALGLAVLKRVHLIDWFTEDGTINLDVLGNSDGAFDECPEFHQLAKCLDESKAFRAWCSTTPVKDIQLALIRHAVSTRSTDEEAAGEGEIGAEGESLAAGAELRADEEETDGSDNGVDGDYDNSDGQNSDNGLEATT